MTTEEAVFDYDASVIGQQVEVGSTQVTAARIAAYCAAVGETNPLYTDAAAAASGPHAGLIAPPGILQTIPVQGGPDAKVKFGNSAFHSGMRMEFYDVIRPDDTITVMAEVKEVYAKTGRTGTMVFAVRRNHYKNQHGTTVAILESSTVHRQTGQA